MKMADKRMAPSLGLLTAGVGLMLVGLSWLTFLGLALVILSESHAYDRKLNSTALWICFAGAVLGLIQGSHSFSRTPPAWWYVAMLVGIWIFGSFRQLGRWRANRRQEP